VRGDVGGRPPDEGAQPSPAPQPCAFVLFVNEENGLRAATGIVTRTRPSWRTTSCCSNQTAACSIPTGFGFTGSDQARAAVTTIAGLLTAARRQSHRRLRRRRRHRPRRHRRQDSDDVARSVGRLLPHPPHAGGHGRPHYAEADVKPMPRPSL
jgi:hypothetical protein